MMQDSNSPPPNQRKRPAAKTVLRNHYTKKAIINDGGPVEKSFLPHTFNEQHPSSASSSSSSWGKHDDNFSLDTQPQEVEKKPKYAAAAPSGAFLSSDDSLNQPLRAFPLRPLPPPLVVEFSQEVLAQAAAAAAASIPHPPGSAPARAIIPSPGDTIVTLRSDSESNNHQNESSGHQFQGASTSIDVGSLVFAPYPGTNECRWGHVLSKVWANDNLYDIKLCCGKISSGVSVNQLYALETSEFKDSILKTGDIVYAPWPGTKPDEESCYWGRISKRRGEKKYDVHFFAKPTETVESSRGINCQYLQRKDEVLYLMNADQIESDPLPSRTQSLKLLLRCTSQQEAAKQKRPVRAAAKASGYSSMSKTRATSTNEKIDATTSPGPQTPTKKRSKTSATSTPKRRLRQPKASKTASPGPQTPTKKRSKTSANSTNDYQLEYIDGEENVRVSVGDLVYAPWPGKNPQNETWYWGKISKEHPKKHFDIKFPDGDLTQNLSIIYLFKLESQGFKDQVLKIGHVVYAPFPGENPQDEQNFFWGRISAITPSTEGCLYKIHFADGDIIESILSQDFHRYQECKYIMEKGWIENDPCPIELLRHGIY